MDHPTLFSSASFAAAEAATRSTDEVLIVDFTASWCAPCQAMEQTTWRDERIAQWVREHGRAIQVDIDQDGATAARFQVRGVPTVVALRRGQEVDRFSGARPADPVLEWLAGVLKGETEVDRLRAKAKDGGIEDRCRLASMLANAGRFDEALQEYLWLWSHAHEVDPRYVGVRNSFLFVEIVQFAQHHAPARDAFRKLRDEAGAPVEAGKLELLDDWFALNQVVGDVSRSVEWFDRASKQPPPGLDFARLLRWLAAPLKEAGRWADLAKLIPDPLHNLDQHEQAMREMLSNSSQIANASIPKEMREEFESALREQLMESLRGLARDIVRALRAAGRTTEAEKVAARAKELDASPEMAQALSGSIASA